MKHFRSLPRALLLAVLLAPLVHAGDGGGMSDLGSLLPGAGSHPSGISGDGTTIVGHALAGHDSMGDPYDHPFVWTEATGMVDLDSGSTSHGGALGVSRDGGTVVGYKAPIGAFRWTSAGGFQALGTSNFSAAVGANADGTVIVGNVDPTHTNGPRDPFVWTAAGGMVLLGDFGGSGTASANAVSDDGSVVVGFADGPSGPHAFRWTAAGGMQDLGTLGGDTSFAYGTSADGNVVVGAAAVAPGVIHAFRWTAAGGMQDLGAFGPHWSGSTFAIGYGVSADGSVVVGSSTHEDSAGGRAFRWTAALGLQDLGTLRGREIYGASASGVSSDGAVLAGTNGPGFVWRLGEYVPLGSEYCDAVANSTGAIGSLQALGSNAIDGNFVQLRADHLPTNTVGYFLTSQTQGYVFPVPGSLGPLCLGGAIGRYSKPGQVKSTGTAGGYALDLDLGAMPQPGGPVAVQPGETWSFQSWYRDIYMGESSNFTTAVSVQFL